jgi:hypothetical protein
MMLALLGAIGCGRGRSTPPEPTTSDAPKTGGDKVTSSGNDAFQWSRQQIDELGLEMDLLADAEVSRGAAGGIHFVIQTQGSLKLAIWWGPGRTLDAWRGFYGPPRTMKLGAETTSTVCGAAARGQTAEIEAGPNATGLVRGDDGQLGHIEAEQPALVSHALSFELDGTPVLVEWAVAPADRARWQAAGAHFFGSLGCPG